jgi:hypothetical protein
VPRVLRRAKVRCGMRTKLSSASTDNAVLYQYDNIST